MTLSIWRFINIFLLALVSGVFWGTWLSLSRSIASFSPDVFLAIGHRMIGNLGPVMPILMPAGLLTTVPVLFLLYRRRSKTLYPTLLGFALYVVALLVTLVVEVPIDNEIKEWTVSSLPPDWQRLRDRWESYHVVRAVASVAGLALILGAALFDSYSIQERPPRI